MAMLLTIAFTHGFQFAIANKMYAFSGHIRVQHFEPEKVDVAEETPVQKNDTVLNKILSTPGVETVQAYATKYAIIKGPESFEGLLLKGVEKNYRFGNLQEFLKAGRWVRFPDTSYSNEIDISSYTAAQLKVKTGDKLLSYFIQNDGSRRVRPLVVAGIFKTGIEDYDRISALVDLRLIQRLNNWGPGDIGGYEIFVKQYNQADTISNLIFDQLPPGWTSRSVNDLYSNIFDWLALQDTTIAIVIIIMVLVAILNLVTCLIILLLERTQMIGVLKSLGAPNLTIQKVFLYHGALITVSGLLFGNIIALGICWLQQRYGFIRLPEDAYFISTAAVHIEWWEVALVNAGTFAICFLILMIPTLIIRRITPVKAILFK